MAGKKGNTLTKTVWQYTEVLPEDTIDFLRGLAEGYGKIKNYTYKRYSGIKSFGRLTPVYDIMGEIRRSGIRTQLGLPSACFDPAVVDAVSDIKSMWAVVRSKLGNLITMNENLTDEDRIYLRTILKLDKTYAAILNHEDYEMPKKAKDLEIDAERLNNLLRRLTRKYLRKPEAGQSDYFSITPAGYAYKDGVLLITTGIHGKRIPIPLKDNRTSDRQLKIFVREKDAAIAIPVESRIKMHHDYTNTVYVHIGYKDMFTLSNGNVYGASLGDITAEETERLTEKNKKRARIRSVQKRSAESGDRKKADNIGVNNLGTQKYDHQKDKERAKTQIFINAAINRMLAAEKPERVVIARPVKVHKTKLPSKSANRKMTRNFNSYIRERLTYKCRMNSIELVEIHSKGTGNICSCCGAEGKRTASGFVCGSCGLQSTTALNGAKNIENKYKNMNSK
ncbi:MAG: transposase [Lachnospiraceae bacterium]|nr:transposase [Lachnospiraceae bacterium]